MILWQPRFAEVTSRVDDEPNIDKSNELGKAQAEPRDEISRMTALARKL